jgi:predicted TIM-barrel fold metal-dependent hydrolase
MPTADPLPTAPMCPAPDPAPRPPRRIALPDGACDTHAHVIGGPPGYPLVDSRSYTPPEAAPAAYLGMLDAVGMARGVLVQVSVHGTDNRLMVETLTAHRDRLRGIAVVGADASDAELARLKDAGVVGLRLNVLFGGGVGFDQLERLGDRCRELGWHLQFLLDARALPELAPRLERLPVPFVVDHMGHMPVSAGIDHPGFQGLLGLLRRGKDWVKLSGAFRTSVAGPPYADTIPFARALLAAAPDRMVWGSDWPHVAHAGPMPNVGDLLDLLADWVPDPAQRDAVLAANPARLYGFG